MSEYWLFAIAALYVAYGLFSKRLGTTIVTGPMIFVTVGFVLSSAGLGVIDAESGDHIITILLEATLAIVLFSDAAVINSTNWRKEAFIPIRLLVIGLPTMIIIGLAVAAVMFTELSIWEAGLIAAILAPTDAALGQAVISNPRVPRRIRQGLATESGLNDGIALVAVVVFLSAAQEALAGGSAGALLHFLASEILLAAVVGIGLGWLGGKAIVYSTQRDWVSPIWLQIGALAIGIGAYGLAVPLGGSGFIAAWLAGLLVGWTTRGKVDEVNVFSESVGSGMTMLSLMIFGAVFLVPALDFVTWETVVYAVLSLLVIRMVSVAISMIGSSVSVVSIGFMGWFGPRGLASIVLAGVVVESSALPAEVQEVIVTVAMITVGLSVFAHGVTAFKGSEAYGRWIERTRPELVEDVAEVDIRDEVPSRFQDPGVRQAFVDDQASGD
ncbi:MAG: cation:proton antiporter [Acidimicrobiia bacterium]